MSSPARRKPIATNLATFSSTFCRFMGGVSWLLSLEIIRLFRAQHREHLGVAQTSRQLTSQEPCIVGLLRAAAHFSRENAFHSRLSVFQPDRQYGSSIGGTA